MFCNKGRCSMRRFGAVKDRCFITDFRGRAAWFQAVTAGRKARSTRVPARWFFRPDSPAPRPAGPSRPPAPPGFVFSAQPPPPPAGPARPPPAPPPPPPPGITVRSPSPLFFTDGCRRARPAGVGGLPQHALVNRPQCLGSVAQADLGALLLFKAGGQTCAIVGRAVRRAGLPRHGEQTRRNEAGREMAHHQAWLHGGLAIAQPATTVSSTQLRLPSASATAPLHRRSVRRHCPAPPTWCAGDCGPTTPALLPRAPGAATARATACAAS